MEERVITHTRGHPLLTIEVAVKNRNWLDITEYAMLLGSGVGTVASIASQQIAFSAAPLSMLMLVNLMNRRRLLQKSEATTAEMIANLDQRVTGHVEGVRRQMEVLPEFSDLNQLKKAVVRTERKLASQFAERLNQLQQDTNDRLNPLLGLNFQKLQQDMDILQTQCNRLREAIAEISAYQHRLATNARVDGLASTSSKMTEELANLKTELAQFQTSFQGLLDDQKLVNNRTLQEQIDHLNRRLSNLPQSFDASALKQDVESLLNVVTDLVSRREFARVQAELEKINQQNHELHQSARLSKISHLIFRKQLEALSTQLRAREEAIDWLTAAFFQADQPTPADLQGRLEQITQGMQLLEERLNTLPPSPDLKRFQTEVQRLVANHVVDLQQQIASVQAVNQRLEQQQVTLQQQVHALPQTVEDTSPLHDRVSALATRVEWTEANLEEVRNQIEATIQQQLEQLSQPRQGMGTLQERLQLETEPSDLDADSLRAELQQTVAAQMSELQQQLASLEASVQEQMEQLHQQWQAAQTMTASDTLDALGGQLEGNRNTEVELANLRAELQQTIAHQVFELQQQLVAMQTLVQSLEQQQTAWQQQPLPAPEQQPLQTEVHTQLTWLANRMEMAELNLDAVQARLEEAITTPAEETAPLRRRKSRQDTLEAFAAGFPADELLADEDSLSESVDRTHLTELQQQLVGLQALIHRLEQEQSTLRHWADQLPETADSHDLQQALMLLTARVDQAEARMGAIQGQVEAALARQAEATQNPGQTAVTVGHELVFDLKSHTPQDVSLNGHSLLSAALAQAGERVIIVWPWPSADTLSEALIRQFEAVLQRGVRIDIGWGHLGEADTIRLPRTINQPKPISPEGRGFLYTILKQLTELKERYPHQFGFKILGTYENFLVCDREFAILSVHPVPTASSVYPELSLGVRSTEPQVIQSLIDRFDQPTLDPTNAAAHFNRATTRYDLGDRQGAVADYTQALEIDRENDVAYNNRGLARFETGDKQGAIADFDAALQINPQNAIAYYNRGFVRSDLGDKLSAIADYTQAIQIRPNFTLAYLYRGLIRTRLGNKQGAIEDYSAAISINPQDAMSRFYRGLAYFKQGQKGKAATDLREAARLFAEQKDKVNRQRALDALTELEKALAGSAHQTAATSLSAS